VRGSAPSLNPLTDVSDEGVADRIPIRNREARCPKKLPVTSLLADTGQQPLAACLDKRFREAIFPIVLVNYFFAPAFFSSMAAWAAARRAMGTRNGEQLT
jgi:hypothetical protein